MRSQGRGSAEPEFSDNRKTDQPCSEPVVPLSSLSIRQKFLSIRCYTQMSSPEQNLFVANLPFHWDDADLYSLFSQHGKVLEARVALDRETGRRRGYGFVKMGTRAEGQEAMRRVSGMEFPDGRVCKVDIANETKGAGGPYFKTGPAPLHAHSAAVRADQSLVTSDSGSRQARSQYPDSLPGERESSRDR